MTDKNGEFDKKTLEGLIKRTTVYLPYPLLVETIKNDFFTALSDRDWIVDSYVSSKRSYRKNNGISSSKTKYPTEIRVWISRNESPIVVFNSIIKEGYVEAFELDREKEYKRYKTIEEFESFPTGKERLMLIDNLRAEIESYFSSRQN